MRGAFGTFAGEQPLGCWTLQKSFPGTKSSKNLDWKVRLKLFCGVNFQGLFGGVFFEGEGRIFVEEKDVEGKVGEGSRTHLGHLSPHWMTIPVG